MPSRHSATAPRKPPTEQQRGRL